MRIKDIYIGGWFQRTTLHLSESYDFLRDGYSSLSLDKDKLRRLRDALEIVSVELRVDDLEHLALETKTGIRFKVCEDGLIVLSRSFREGEDLAADIKALTDYYEQKLSPAFGYLFSLGAPVPKELANIKTVYPYFVVIEDASREEALGLLEQFKQKKYFEVSNPHFDLFRGDKFYIINDKKERADYVARFIEEQVFLREFKGQLHRYLNLHRIIWERIAQVKERGSIRGAEIGKLKDQVEGWRKTVNLIEARINQMDTYLSTRERIVKGSAELKDFLDVIEYRYETLGDTLAYMQEIWEMTKNYVDAALELFTSLDAKATQNSIKSLTIITSIGVGGTLLGLLVRSDVPQITIVGAGYLAGMIAFAYVSNEIIKWFYKHKNYSISEVEYDKDIK